MLDFKKKAFVSFSEIFLEIRKSETMLEIESVSIYELTTNNYIRETCVVYYLTLYIIFSKKYIIFFIMSLLMYIPKKRDETRIRFEL